MFGIWAELPSGRGLQGSMEAPAVLVSSAQGTYFHAEGANLT